MTRDKNHNTLTLKLVEDAYLAASGQMSWKQFMGIFSQFPGVKISLLSHDNGFNGLNTVIPQNYDPDYVQSYLSYYGAKNPKKSYSQKMINSSKGAWGHDFIRPDILEKTEFYNDWLKPQGDLATGYAYNLFQEQDNNVSLVSHVSLKHIDQAQTIEHLMQDVGSHLKRALTLQKTLLGQQLQSNNFEHVLNCLQNPVLLTDKKGKLCFANKLADTLLSKGELIYLNRERILSFKDPYHQKLAQHQLHSLASDSSVGGSLSLRLPVANKHSITLFTSPISLCPIQASNYENFWKAPGHIAWFFISPQPSHNIDYKLIASVLQVTQTEAKLALSLMNGYSLKEYSLHRNVSKETARSQLRSLREKTGTKNQADLVGMLNRIFSSVKMD